MKLSFKIMSIVFLVIFVLLVIDGYLSVRREIEAYENDLRHDTVLLGHALRQLVFEAWQRNGPEHALALIDEVNKDEQHVKIRWVWLDVSPNDPFAPRIPRAKLTAVLRGHEAWFRENQENGSGEIYTYIPLEVDNSRPGALEVRESLATLRTYTRHSIVWAATLTALLLSAGGIVVWASGSRFIGRPLKELMGKTRRIGAGDLSADLVLHGHDELSDLAVAMNRMCEQLSAAQEDIRKETEARIAALEQLRHAERLATIGRLSAGIAHELGTPLNVVTGRAKLIAAEDLEREAIIENSRIIREQVDRMTRIMRQLLDFARRRTAKRSPSDIRTTIHQVLDMLNATARKHGVTLELVESGDIPMIAIDHAQIQQVLTNLILNGIQAMPNGGRLELGIEVERARPPARASGDKNEYVAIHVRDEGVGISEENKKRIFEPFFTTKEVGKGTGLGLSIAHGIVEEHDGWIEVESKPGTGTCFTVYLPMENNP
jgi:signal transduction histidine kinase